MHSSEPTGAISRQRGSGGSYIGQLVAQRLGRHYIDRDLLRVAAEYLKKQEAPPAEASPSFWARLQRAVALGAADGVYCAPSAMAVYEEGIARIALLRLANGNLPDTTVHRAIIAR